MTTTMTSEEKTRVITAAAEDKKAEDIVVLNVGPRTLIAEYFVICSGNSKVHLRAIADGILEKAKEAGVKDKRVEGYGPGGWILMDYGDVVVHIMMEEERAYYQLEDLWKEAEVVLGALRNSDE